MTKPTKWHVCQVKTQISLGIRPVWSESSLSAWRKLGSLATRWVQAKTLIRLGRCPGWSESSLGTQSFWWFCHEAAHIMHILFRERCSQRNFTMFWKMRKMMITNHFWDGELHNTGNISAMRYVCLKNMAEMSRLMTKPTKWLCAQQRLRSAWASVQSDQSLHCSHEEVLGTWLPSEHTAKTLIRLGGCPGGYESLLGAKIILLVLSWGGSYGWHIE